MADADDLEVAAVAPFLCLGARLVVRRLDGVADALVVEGQPERRRDHRIVRLGEALEQVAVRELAPRADERAAHLRLADARADALAQRVARGGQGAEALFQFGRRLEEQLDARRPQRARELRRRPQRARELRSHYC